MGVSAIVGGALGLGGALLGSRSQSRAAETAAQATTDASREQIALAREIYGQQRQDLEPFRQQELQRANALGEIFGFDPVGQTQTPQFTDSPFQAGTSVPGFAGGRFGSFERNARGFADLEQFDPRTLYTQPGGGFRPGAPQRLTNAPAEPVTMERQQDSARERFENSMFNDVYREGHQRDVTRIDSGLASQGLAFSGARMQAVEDARSDRFGSTFSQYLSGLMGQAPQTATANTNNAAGAFGAGVSNAIAQRGVGEAQSAYAQGQANAGLWNGVAGLGGFAAGGGFSR